MTSNYTVIIDNFTKDEKITLFKSIGIILGFSGVIFLFLDKLIINDSNLFYALIVLAGSTFYAVGGILTLKIKNKGNENLQGLQYRNSSCYRAGGALGR